MPLKEDQPMGLLFIPLFNPNATLSRVSHLQHVKCTILTKHFSEYITAMIQSAGREHSTTRHVTQNVTSGRDL